MSEVIKQYGAFLLGMLFGGAMVLTASLYIKQIRISVIYNADVDDDDET